MNNGKRGLFNVKSLLVIVSAVFFMLSCNSKSEVDVAATDALVNAFAMTNWDKLPQPELSPEETALVDSVSKLNVFAEYRKANKELMNKVTPYLAKLSQEELDDLRNHGTDSLFVSEFSAKVKAQLDIKKELKAVDEAHQSYQEEVKSLNLSSMAMVALLIKLFQ